MDIRIIKSFGVADSPHPFHPGECLTLPNAKAREWIAEGKAVPLNATVVPKFLPTKRKREKATRF
jgi:hypothetical protein